MLRRHQGLLAVGLCAVVVAGHAAGSQAQWESPAPLPASFSAAASTIAANDDQEQFARFIDELIASAERHGLSRAGLRRVTSGLQHDPDVLALARRQPEFSLAPWQYIERVVSDQRIEAGRQSLRAQAPRLAAIEASLGVDRFVLAAIWGIESNFGISRGDRPVIRSLATLASQNDRRTAFWRAELIAALRLIERGDIPAEKLNGSWAGAMGHMQFMPTTFLRHGVDFDGDGQRNIWGETATDALASAASYLTASGWSKDQPWGVEVRLQPAFDLTGTLPSDRQSIGSWMSKGVAIVGEPRILPSVAEPLRLILPAGAKGPAFLVTGNFDALLRYNQSTSYALAVGHLADRIAGGGPIVSRWPVHELPLTLPDREELQRRLAAIGYDAGGIDGIIGGKTRLAIREFQISRGLTADGHANTALLEMMRKEVSP